MFVFTSSIPRVGIHCYQQISNVCKTAHQWSSRFELSDWLDNDITWTNQMLYRESSTDKRDGLGEEIEAYGSGPKCGNLRTNLCLLVCQT